MAGRRNDDPMEGKILYNYNKTNFSFNQINFKVRQSKIMQKQQNNQKYHKYLHIQIE
jgi:hypothetical protein